LATDFLERSSDLALATLTSYQTISKMKKLILILSAVLITTMMTISCGIGESKEEASPKEVTIGKQVWMTENLNEDKFQNGDPIPEAKTDEEWVRAGRESRPAWCYYNNDPDNGEKYGRLYNWYAVNDPRGLAPKTWRIPSMAEWDILSDYLGYDEAAVRMKSKIGWEHSGIGNNRSGFSGLPGGFRDSNGTFSEFGKSGHWWSTTEVNDNNVFHRELNFLSDFPCIYLANKGEGLSVRCLD
jgi:uncharacterized protein (TIGR02145 family)